MGQHEYFDMYVPIQYRVPGTHPEEDTREAIHADDTDSFVRVKDGSEVWFVAKIFEPRHRTHAYVFIPRNIAQKALRKHAVLPYVED